MVDCLKLTIISKCIDTLTDILQLEKDKLIIKWIQEILVDLKQIRW